MNISVTEKRDLCDEYEVNTIVDGMCLHRRVSTEQNLDGEWIDTCERCGAWRYDDRCDDVSFGCITEWFNEIILEDF